MVRGLARFRHEHRIHDMLERLRESFRQLRERFKERFRKRTDKIIKKQNERIVRDTERAKTFNNLSHIRQRFRYKIDDIFFKVETLKSYISDVIVKNNIIRFENVLNAVKHGLSRIRDVDYNNLYALTRYVARFMNPPCGSMKYYVKITYQSIQALKQLYDRFVIYVRNWISNKKLRDRILNAVTFVIQLLLRSREKPEDEDYNSETLANPESRLDANDKVDIMRSDITDTKRTYTLGFLLRHPSFIGRIFATKLGLSEFSADSHHCSLYAHMAEISRRKHYLDLDKTRYYDFIIYRQRIKMRGIK
jgi:hypothetical protein